MKTKNEKTNIDWEKISFNIITSAGSAKSDAMEAIYAAKQGDFKEAKKLIEAAEKEIAKASGMHFEIIQKEAQGQQLEFKVLFLHAEDQLLTTQTLILMAQELVDVHVELKKLK